MHMLMDTIELDIENILYVYMPYVHINICSIINNYPSKNRLLLLYVICYYEGVFFVVHRQLLILFSHN